MNKAQLKIVLSQSGYGILAECTEYKVQAFSFHKEDVIIKITELIKAAYSVGFKYFVLGEKELLRLEKMYNESYCKYTQVYECSEYTLQFEFAEYDLCYKPI